MSLFSYFAVGKIFKKQKARVDSMVFVLHYRCTFVIFFISSLLVTAKELVGSPIACVTKSKTIKPLINTYCYIMSTFSVPSHKNHTVGQQLAYHGTGTGIDDDGFITIHAYYLWVPIVLFLQAIMFYLPHFIWKKLDGGVYETVINGLDKFTLDYKTKESKYKLLTKYMITYLHTHQSWALWFFLCEALNLVNVVGNIYFVDYFLGGTFLTYGTEVLNFPEMDPESRVDPMTRIFPKMAKCTFRKFGPSGTIETHDAFCLLAVNIINEKIYIFIWFWLVILSAITAAWLIFRLAVILSSALRNRMLALRGRWAGSPNLKIIAEKCNLGDWFLIYQLGSHMEPSVYGEFLKEFAKELQNTVSTLERKPMLMGN